MRFRRRVKIAPGVTLNVGKKSAGVRVGGKGYGVSANPKSGVRGTVGLPGTGVSYSRKLKKASSSSGCLVYLAATGVAAATFAWFL